MAGIKTIFVLSLVAICHGQARGPQYSVPPAKLEAIAPTGWLKVTLPDDGFSLFAFHGKLNEEMDGLEAGHWARDITKPKDGVWTFRDRAARLKVGDKVYFWTFVIKDGLGYRQDDGEWTVTEFVDEQGNPQEPGPQASTSGPTQRPTPAPARPPTKKPDPPCKPSETVVQGVTSVCKGALVFNEEFDKSNVKDLDNWSPEVKFPEEPDYPFNLYTTTKTLTLEDGDLNINPLLLENQYHEGMVYEELDLTNTCTGQVGTTECQRKAIGANILPPVMTGKVTTKHKFNFKYGRLEVRAKLPAGNWLLPEINLEPRDNIYGVNRYASGLMRVAFVRGNPSFSKKLSAGPVLSDAEPFRSALLKEKIGIDNWNKGYHNYTLIWKPDGVSMQVDGLPFGTVSPGEGFYHAGREHAVPHASLWHKGSVMAPLDELFYISLGVRVGGVHDFPDSKDKPWKNRGNKAVFNFWEAKDTWFSTWYDSSMKVDYVRVYAL
ncbi:Beta-1-3-glucan-binding protein [Plutella xylostella]|uniref:Beta-1-3-glucan-binding protein n=1 Tax=Plutella xylostella TaxID=51655 RepID=A0ABQ7PSA6_PLUXY|nr:Beta-1-3-glucan-binding protein [Plutella xylostella]